MFLLKVFLFFWRIEYEDGKIVYDGIFGLSLDLVFRKILRLCSLSRVWNLVECLEFLRLL